MQLHKKVADQWLRKQAAPAMLRVVMQELEKLQELSDNLTEIEDQVHQTFRTAKKLDPEVKSQFDALKKAREGLKQARATGAAVAEILKHYPEDKTAQRAAKDAVVMIKRFEKHEADASKIIRRLSKKALPPALKKMAASLGRMLKTRLNDPKKLTVQTWQAEDATYDGGRREGVKYLVLFRVNGGAGTGLQESSLRSGVFGVNVHPNGYSAGMSNNPQPTTAKKQVAVFMENLKGNPDLKGEGDRTKLREEKAKKVFTVIGQVWQNLYGRGQDARERIEPKGMGMTFDARVLPHDSYYGPQEIEDAREDETRKLNKALGPALKLFKDDIKSYDIYDGEKGWLYLNVQMK